MISPPLYRSACCLLPARNYTRTVCTFILLLIIGSVALAADASARFQEHLITQDLQSGYQVVACDMNNDGRRDLLALASRMSELIWFENPTWQKHVIAGSLSRMINVDAWDTDGDRIPELVLSSSFSMEPTKSVGNVWLLKHKGDPTEHWTITEIDRLPASHRIRWADIDGTGRKVAINVPLAGAKAAAPEYKDKVPIVLYHPGIWKRELISRDLEGVVHGATVLDWDGDGREDLLTASFQGVHLFRKGEDGAWRTTQLAGGSPEVWPKGGASEIAVGRLGERRFFCTIEPWHGNEVAVYTQQTKGWERTVIDDTLLQGHALLTTDLNGDGLDEIVAGFRSRKHGAYIYTSASPKGDRWSRSVLDSDIATSACAAADLNGDERPDLACIGGQHLKWYENLGLRK